MQSISGAYRRSEDVKYKPEPTFEVVGYEPRRPVYTSWSLKHPECFAAVFWQTAGNEARAIGSRRFEFSALHECFLDIRASFPWKLDATHIVPEDTDPITFGLFDDAELSVDTSRKLDYPTAVHLTRELFAVMSVDTNQREWVTERENNFELVEALNAYGAQESNTDTYSKSPSHSWAVYYAEAVETFAIWFMLGGTQEWARKPDHSKLDRGVI